VTSPYLVEKLILRNNALCVLLCRVQYLEFLGREGSEAAAFSSQLHVAEVHIPVIEKRRRPSPSCARIDAPRTRANTPLPGNDEDPGRPQRGVAQQGKACGLIRRTREIVAVRLEKSVQRPLGISNRLDHQDSRHDVHPSDRNKRTRHGTQPWIFSQVEYRDHRALLLGTLLRLMLIGDRFYHLVVAPSEQEGSASVWFSAGRR
jgi:hypothetical protein